MSIRKRNEYLITCAQCEGEREMHEGDSAEGPFDKQAAATYFFQIGWDTSLSECPACAVKRGGRVLVDDAYTRVFVSGPFTNGHNKRVVNVSTLMKKDIPAHVETITLRAGDVGKLSMPKDDVQEKMLSLRFLFVTLLGEHEGKLRAPRTFEGQVVSPELWARVNELLPRP